ncbi:MAG: uroporphyrinogen-III C-methyltransferase [Sulfuricella sp.]|nr:uroporphyrinogen-III C-methyltransferase [Sulfuricella sp.]
MNNETSPEAPANPQSDNGTASAQPPSGVAWRRVEPALATAVVALVLLGWQWFDTRQQFNAVEQTVGKKLGEFDTRNKESAINSAQAREDMKQALVKVGLLEQKLAESQGQQVALEAMYQELSRNRDEWVLAEIEQILLTASQQLQLAGDAKAALIALQTADSRLQRYDKPLFIPLRKAVNQDIQRLQALPLVDVAGYTLKLDGLVAALDDLPLLVGEEIAEERSTPKARPDDNPWTKLSREIWQDMKQLVRIQNMENPQAPLLPPTQAYFLRENLKLRLLSARLAVLRHDESGYKSDLKTAEEWLRRYFDLKSKAGKTALTSLKQLASSSVAIELPDISASLNAARSFKLTRDKGGR